MKTVLRGFVSAALLLLASVAYAGHPAPGVQVTVKKGGAAVFNTITDTTGQFTTGDLEPGEYQIELRGVKVAPPVRYFLVLSGARPVGQTLTNAGGDLAMQAQVRRLTSIRGQVSANRIIVLPGMNPTANATSPGAATTTSASSSNSRVTLPTAPAGQMPATGLRRAPGRSATPAAISTPAVSASRSAAPASTTAPNAARPSSPATPTSLQTTSRTTASAAAAPATGSRIIGGKRYIWVPSAPGSNLGRWVPETPQPGASSVAKPAGVPAPTTSQRGR